MSKLNVDEISDVDNSGPVTITDGLIVSSGGIVSSGSAVLTSASTANFPAGSVLQVVNFQTGAVASGTTTIPFDNTIPQITEGNEFMTLAITPISATSTLLINVVSWNSCNPQDEIVVALFQDSTANALAAISHTPFTATARLAIGFTHKMTSGTTSATTFKVRAGMASAGTITFNGLSGAGKLGGVGESSITIMEIAA
jgi:hypothetical protein